MRIEHRLEILAKALRQIKDITALPSLDPHFAVVERIAADAIAEADALHPVTPGPAPQPETSARNASFRQAARLRRAHARKSRHAPLPAKEPATC